MPMFPSTTNAPKHCCVWCCRAAWAYHRLVNATALKTLLRPAEEVEVVRAAVLLVVCSEVHWFSVVILYMPAAARGIWLVGVFASFNCFRNHRSKCAWKGAGGSGRCFEEFPEGCLGIWSRCWEDLERGIVTTATVQETHEEVLVLLAKVEN